MFKRVLRYLMKIMFLILGKFSLNIFKILALLKIRDRFKLTRVFSFFNLTTIRRTNIYHFNENVSTMIL